MFLPPGKAMHLRRDEPNGSDMPTAWYCLRQWYCVAV